MLQEGATDADYEVYILKGGFSEFQQLFRVSKLVNSQYFSPFNAPFLQHDPEFVKNWDARARD